MPTLRHLLLVFLPLASVTACRAAERVDFETHVRPLFKAYCFDCHGEGDKLRGSLDLRLRRLALQGGENGPAVVAGKPQDSLLYQRVRDGAMPPGKKKLTAEEVALIGRWIADGANTKSTEPTTVSTGMIIAPEDRAFWAFQPIGRPTPPQVRNSAHLSSAVDAFLLARLEAAGLAFAPEADRRTLIRRATIDLHGLPPSADDVTAFVNDAAPDAYEKLLDRLLNSPRYGERWGRHWLDVAGYADSEGYTQEDPVRPHAYKYRDYVIRALNADKPFDQFVVEQLAGDELVRASHGNAPRDPVALEKLIATGFLRTAPDGTGSPGVEQKTARNQVVADTLKIVGSALLGLTLDCAQCHNHRYDPIPQTDYYRLRAVFEPAYDVVKWRVPAGRRLSLYTPADRTKAQQIEGEAAKLDKERLAKQQQFIEATFNKELARLPEDIRDRARLARSTAAAKRNAEQKKLLRDHPSLNVSEGSLYLYDSKAAAELKKMADAAAALRATKPVEDFVAALTEVPGQVPVTYRFHRGDPDQPKQALPPGGLTILDERLELRVEKVADLATTGRRLALARWLTDPRHPLTARVIVNRVWMHHFGRGLVGSPSDFGKLGERPTHPELLDWLAVDLQSSGWSLKRLHRQLMTSTAYRQSARRDPNTAKLDPDNRLLGRMSLRRLEAEAVRDGVLAVSGALQSRMFGPAVPVRENDVGQVIVGKGVKDLARGTTTAQPLDAGEAERRSVYIQTRRSMPLGVLETFDAATTQPNCERRNSSTVPPQALLFMNNEFILEQSALFATRLVREAGDDVRAQVRRAFLLAFATEPSATESDDAVKFLAHQTTQLSNRQQALATFCQALLSSNRFLYY